MSNAKGTLRLALRGVSVDFRGRSAVSDASLEVAAGEAVAILGPSGAGKTSLLRLLGASLRALRGEVWVNDVALHTLSSRELKALRARIGFIHQDHGLVPTLRVAQNVLAGRLGQHGFLRSLREVFAPPRAELRRVHAILERVGIPDKLYQRTDTLSLGQQQRVAIARALYQRPEALLADEPVASVDPARARDTLGLLVGIAQEEGLALCVSLHDVGLAREFFPRLVGVRQGRIAFDEKRRNSPNRTSVRSTR